MNENFQQSQRQFGSRYMRKAQAAQFLGISVRTLTDWQRARIIPFRKIRRAVLFDPHELEQAVGRFRVAAVGEGHQ